MNPDDSMKDLVEPVFRALIQGGFSIEIVYQLLFPLAHEGKIWTTELYEIRKEIETEQESRKIWNRFNSIEE